MNDSRDVTVMQAHADVIHILSGADVDFNLPHEAPCTGCGDMVNLDTPITFVVQDAATGFTESKVMSEGDARAIMANAGVEVAPVRCQKCGPDDG